MGKPFSIGDKELVGPIKSLIVADLAEVRVSRTHRRPLRATTGFEDREDHRSLGTSSSAITCSAAALLQSRYDLI
jgi:hypothetical protein